MTELARTAQGTISVSPGALVRLVVRAAEGADGARVRRPRRALEVSVTGGRVRVSLELAARYGALLPDLARDVQNRVAGVLEGMCGLEVESIDVSIEEVEE